MCERPMVSDLSGTYVLKVLVPFVTCGHRPLDLPLTRGGMWHMRSCLCEL